LQSGGQSQSWVFLGFQVGRKAADLRTREKATACQGLQTAPPGAGGSDQGVQPGYGIGRAFNISFALFTFTSQKMRTTT
jgi:hypothetical protein